MTLRSTRTIWQAAGQPRFAPPDADLQVDVAIVGGGITGLTTALLLADAGKSVALLEGRHVGAGVSGASTAHLTEAVDARYHRLESKFGREGAGLVRASSRLAIDAIAKLAHEAACGFEWKNGYLFSERAEQVGELDGELVAAERAGASVQRSAVPLGIPTAGGICFAHQAQVDPGAYVATLARRATASGARIFERAGMLDVTGSAPLRVETDQGVSVTADAVVLATHAPFAKLTLQLQLAQYRSYVLAGAVSQAPDGLFWDLEDPYHYVRSARVDGRDYVVVGGADHRTGVEPKQGADAPYTELEAYAARLGVPTDARWSAQVVESADGLPFIGKVDPDRAVYVATGFAGNGVTFGTLAAHLIADELLGRQNPYAELYRPTRVKPLASLASVIAENAETAVHAVAGHVQPVSDQPLAELRPGEGRVLKDQGEKLAVYRDQDGKIHALSCVCTHQGCQVAFNPVERSWDCPCHGSRFDIDGRVLDGPATKPLEQKHR